MTLQTSIDEQRKTQEMMDTLLRNEPVAYFHGTPVFTSFAVPKGELWFVNKEERRRDKITNISF